ncbi:MAG: hypothetical protein JSS76_17995 [Bacteroidetes bacterium]|nr:hypothetical protein [Bacteroidota bacterium]
MKIKIILAGILTIAALMGCNKLKHIPFDYSYHKYIEVPAAPVPGTTVTVPVIVATNIDSILEANHTNAGLLQSAKLKSLNLSISSPASSSFGVIRDIDVYVVTGSGDIAIAQKHNIDPSANTLMMDVNDVELKPYLTAENMTLKVTGTTTSGYTQDMTLYFNMTVHFEANLLAAL